MGPATSIRYATPGCSVLSVPNTPLASACLSGRHTSSMWTTASITPSGSRSARPIPGASPSAASSEMSRVIGIGHSVPSASRMSATTDS